MDFRIRLHIVGGTPGLTRPQCESMLRRTSAGLVSFLFRWRRRMATIAVALLAGWIALHVMSGPNGWMAYRNKKVEYQRLEEQVGNLQQENAELESRIKALKSDPKAIEKEAREQLRYAKPGEVIYVMPEAKPPKGKF